MFSLCWPIGKGLSNSSAAQSRRANERKATGVTITDATCWDPQVPDREVGLAMDAIEEMDSADLYSIRMKMEEKRKRIEAEKRQLELMASKQREKVGKAAFLQVRKCRT